MAYLKGGRVGKTDSPRLTPPEKPGRDEQGKEGATGQFNEPVVPDQGRKISAKLDTDAPQVIPFETTAAAEREQ
jgi:hypothetical protein